MATLIDGYNVLHVVGILDRRVGPGTLERARNNLLGFLATSLTDAERAQTTIVFDAKNAPPGLPRESHYRGIRVLFAVNHDDADELLEALIRADSAPRKLVVVSSDHQIQRAATRRRATAVDSDRWYDEMSRRRRDRGIIESDANSTNQRSAEPPDDKPNGDRLDLANPFPPGYAHDLLDEDD